MACRFPFGVGCAEQISHGSAGFAAEGGHGQKHLKSLVETRTYTPSYPSFLLCSFPRSQAGLGLRSPRPPPPFYLFIYFKSRMVCSMAVHAVGGNTRKRRGKTDLSMLRIRERARGGLSPPYQ